MAEYPEGWFYNEVRRLREEVDRLKRSLFGEGGPGDGIYIGLVQQTAQDHTDTMRRLDGLETWQAQREQEFAIRLAQSEGRARLINVGKWVLTLATSGGVIIVTTNIWRLVTGQ